jgi:primase-polymerase (primpol)-like protein
MYTGGMQDFGNGPGGPMIQGKWINRMNGNIINVRDSIINGDEMLLITDKGQISMDDFSRNYVQASADIYDEHGNVIGQEDIDPSTIVMSTRQKVNNPKVNMAALEKGGKIEEIQNNDDILPEDMSQITSVNTTDILHTPLNSNNINSNNTNKQPESEKTKLIKTIFEKSAQPTISLDIEWAAFPKNELEMLMNYFGVTQDEIAEYISNSIQKDAIIEAVNRFLTSRFI